MMMVCRGKKLKRTDGDVGGCRILRLGAIRVLGELRAATRHRILGSRMEKARPTVGEGNDKIRTDRPGKKVEV